MLGIFKRTTVGICCAFVALLLTFAIGEAGRTVQDGPALVQDENPFDRMRSKLLHLESLSRCAPCCFRTRRPERPAPCYGRSSAMSKTGDSPAVRGTNHVALFKMVVRTIFELPKEVKQKIEKIKAPYKAESSYLKIETQLGG